VTGRSQRRLRAAAAYNAAWGGGVVLVVADTAWKCVGMMVLCYAPGYWLASRKPLPELVAVGLLGKVLGPLGFVYAYASGRLPLAFGLVVLANDVVWWPSFVRYLRETARMPPAPRAASSAPVSSRRSHVLGARPTDAPHADG
jgi:hypothetical protein